MLAIIIATMIDNDDGDDDKDNSDGEGDDNNNNTQETHLFCIACFHPYFPSQNSNEKNI